MFLFSVFNVVHHIQISRGIIQLFESGSFEKYGSRRTHVGGTRYKHVFVCLLEKYGSCGNHVGGTVYSKVWAGEGLYISKKENNFTDFLGLRCFFITP